MARNPILVLLLALLAVPAVGQDTATLDGEPAIRFMAGHGHLTTYCDGQLWVTATRVFFDGVTQPSHSFALSRAEVSEFHQAHALGFDYLKVEGGGKTYRIGLYPDMTRQFGDRIAFGERAWKDFQGAYAEVKRAEAQRTWPAGLVKGSSSPNGPMLEFPAILGQGGIWFKSARKVTVWEEPDADGSAYLTMLGPVEHGTLQVTADRVRFVPAPVPGDAELTLDAPKSEMRLRSGAGGYPRLIANFRHEGRMALMLATVEPGGRNRFHDATPLLRALGPEFDAFAASVLPKPTLVVVTKPGASIEIDGGRHRAEVGGDGRLTLTDLEPGKHTVSAALAGYQPWRGEVTLTSGAASQLDVPLVAVPPPPLPAPKPSGPPAFALKDLVTMLQGGVSPKRVGALVQERGVDFALDDAAEKQIRTAGGDAELLLVIAKSKK